MSIPLHSSSIDELFYDNYQYYALDYCIETLRVLIENYEKNLEEMTRRSEIDPNDIELYHKKLNILRYEIVAKVCHYAENLGAFAYAFTKSDNVKTIYGIICDYQVDWVTNFYNYFLKSSNNKLRNLKY